MKKRPLLKGTPPGPKARKWVAKDRQMISPSNTRSYPLVVERGDGAWIWDVDGNQFLDFTAGIAVTATGHSHPRVVEAITQQAHRFIHMSGTDFYYPSQIILAERLTSLTPGTGPKKVFFTNSGAEATEAAMKLTRHQTKRPLYLAFYGGFHGRTLGALSLTASKAVQRRGFSPLLPQVHFAPYSYCYRCPVNMKPETCDVDCVKWIREILFTTSTPPEEVAAIFVEPIQGEGGYVVPHPLFLQRLSELATEFGILLVADEIQSGMGRTGRMFASEHFGLIPDIITLAKGIASGLPLGAMVARSDLMNWPSGAHANTFGGNPLSCEAALVTIDLLEKELITNAAKVGEYLREKLIPMQKDHRLIGEVRGKGLMIGIELVTDRETKERAVAERNRVIQFCFKKGLLILGCGQSVIRLMPPLTITKAQADIALSILDEALTAVETGR